MSLTDLTVALLACTGHEADPSCSPTPLPPGTPAQPGSQDPDEGPRNPTPNSSLPHHAPSAGPPPIPLASALAGTSYATNFEYDTDAVLSFVANGWSFNVTLLTISQIYVEKLTIDIRNEEGLLGGLAGPRVSLEAAMYDFFTSRYGCRPAAELHLAAFLYAVRRFRGQHPKASAGQLARGPGCGAAGHRVKVPPGHLACCLRAVIGVFPKPWRLVLVPCV